LRAGRYKGLDGAVSVTTNAPVLARWQPSRPRRRRSPSEQHL